MLYHRNHQLHLLRIQVISVFFCFLMMHIQTIPTLFVRKVITTRQCQKRAGVKLKQSVN